MRWQWSIRRLLTTAVLVAAVFVVTPALPANAGGSSQWPSGGGASWADDAVEASRATPAVDVIPVQRKAAASSPAPPPPVVTPAAVPAVLTPPIVFPVAGPADYANSFGVPRLEGRTHEGIDIFADKMTPVVAIADGTVSLIRNGVGTDCCVLRIRHDDGRSSLYLHLNNDTPDTDDGLGYGIAEGIEMGSRVTAGMVIGYVGDSGNAEETSSHLHIELNDASGALLNPHAYLQIAQGADPALFASELFAQSELLPNTGLPIAVLFGLSVALLLAGTSLVGSRPRDSEWVAAETKGVVI